MHLVTEIHYSPLATVLSIPEPIGMPIQLTSIQRNNHVKLLFWTICSGIARQVRDSNCIVRACIVKILG
jgi:hypothetical protein